MWSLSKELKMYNSLWENHPKVKELKAELAESKAKLKAEGRAEGEIQALRRTLVHIVQVRFPDLTEVAQQKAEQISNAGALDLLVQQIIVAPDEDKVRWALTAPIAS
jgi:hypothetical protein